MKKSILIIFVKLKPVFYPLNQNHTLHYMNEKIQLEKELQRLQEITGKCKDFELVWIPKKNSHIEGKVEDNTITIYSQEIKQAIETLRHEFVDYIVCDAIKPYIKLVNVLLSAISRDSYDKKEESVETLLNLLLCDK